MALQSTPAASLLTEDIKHCITTSKLMKTGLKWTIQQFGSQCIDKKSRELLKSAKFSATGDEDVVWNLELYPNGQKPSAKGTLALYLCCKSPFQHGSSKVHFQLTLIDEHTNLELWRATSHDFIDKKKRCCRMAGAEWGFTKIPQAKFLKIENLLIVCTLEYQGEQLKTLEAPFLSSSLDPNDGVEKLAQMFTSMSIGDVTLVVKNEEFPAHKAMLAARSSVFGAMFQHDIYMLENSSNRVELVDVEPDTFKTLLRFIYTDQVDLTAENSTALLAAADRYSVDPLKLKCEKFLAQDLSIENCCERLMLADAHNAKNLKKAAWNVMLKSSAKVKMTDGWKTLMPQARPELLREIIEILLPA